MDNLTSITKGDTCKIVLDGVITQDKAKEFTSLVYNLENYDEIKNLSIGLNSQGGDVLASFSIHSAIKNSTKNLTLINEGVCWSAMSYIFLSVPKENRKIYSSSSLMVHNPYNSSGEPNEAVNTLKNSLQNLLGKDLPDIENLMNKETFLNASEMLKYGLVDKDNIIQVGLPVYSNDRKEQVLNIYNMIDNYLINNLTNMEENKIEVSTEEIKDVVETTIEETVTPETEPTEEIKNEASELEIKIAELEKANKELSERLIEINNKKEIEQKREILAQTGIEETAYENWLKLDLTTLTNCVNSMKGNFTFKKIEVKNQAELTHDDFIKMPSEEKTALLENNKDLYFKIYKPTKK